MSNLFSGGRDGMEIFGINALRAHARKAHIRASRVLVTTAAVAAVAGLAALI